MPFMNNDRESFLWKFVDIKNTDEVDNLKKLFLDNLPSVDNFFIPLDLGIKEFLGMEVGHSVLIIAAPTKRSQIHEDYRADKLKLALNVPLKNCDHSITEFWNCQGADPDYELTSIGVPYNRYKIENCIKISEFKLTKPVIFNTKIPHSVFNLSSEPRLAISIRFRQDPWHLVNL